MGRLEPLSPAEAKAADLRIYLLSPPLRDPEGLEALRQAAGLYRGSFLACRPRDAPLVDRDDALRRLERTYARPRSGAGGVVLISG